MCIINRLETEIHFRQTTTSTPGQFIAGLADFGTGRSKLFASSDEYLKIHHLGRSEADVTEDSGVIWERLHCDWSGPNHVVRTTTGSNVWRGAFSHTYALTRQPNGSIDIDLVVSCVGKNVKGGMLGFVLGTIGSCVWERGFENSVEAIETRSGAPRKEAAPETGPLVTSEAKRSSQK